MRTRANGAHHHSEHTGMLSSTTQNQSQANHFARQFSLILVERVLHAVCMGAATLLPAYFLKNGLNEIYFGSVSSVGAVAAVAVILTLPLLLKKCSMKHVARLSGLLMLVGYALFFYADQVPSTLQGVGFLALPCIAAGWVAHFTLGSIMVSQISSNASRQQNFMIYAAFSTLGLSLGPIVGHAILEVSASHAALFACLVLLAVIALLTASARPLDDGQRPPQAVPGENERGTMDRTAVLGSPAMFFVALVFLQCAIFTIIFNFQVVFSNLNGLSASIFFACWAVGIMAPRLIVGGWVSRQDNRIVLPLLTSFLASSLFALAAGPTSNLAYGLTALSLGISYGLSYPILQAETVKFSSVSARDLFLVAFSLSYFLAYYLTPLAAGILVATQGYNVLFFAGGLIAVVMTFAAIAFYRCVPNAAPRN